MDELSGPHRSIPGNLLIAEAFHRTGAVGRCKNRVIEACERDGIEPPTFEDLAQPDVAAGLHDLAVRTQRSGAIQVIAKPPPKPLEGKPQLRRRFDAVEDVIDLISERPSADKVDGCAPAFLSSAYDNSTT